MFQNLGMKKNPRHHLQTIIFSFTSFFPLTGVVVIPIFETEEVTFSGRRISIASDDLTIEVHHRTHDPIIVDVIDAPTQSFDVGRWVSLQLRGR